MPAAVTVNRTMKNQANRTINCANKIWTKTFGVRLCEFNFWTACVREWFSESSFLLDEKKWKFIVSNLLSCSIYGMDSLFEIITRQHGSAWERDKGHNYAFLWELSTLHHRISRNWKLIGTKIWILDLFARPCDEPNFTAIACLVAPPSHAWNMCHVTFLSGFFSSRSQVEEQTKKLRMMA